MPEITHANQVRGAEFKRLVAKPFTWILTLGFALVAGIGTGAFLGPAVGLIGFAVIVLLGMLITFAIADSKAEDAFYAAFAESRGLSRSDGSLGPMTPLLRKGDSRKTNELFTGKLADDLEGNLALYTYTVESTDSDGDRTETEYPFTVVTFQVPETVEHIPELMLQRKSGLKALEKFEDTFRRDHERVTLESEAMRERYEIFVKKEQDAIWVRRLFSPSFIVWLTDTPPKKYAFELVEGALCCFVPKHRDNTEGFDEMISVSCEVARRLRDEAIS
jgi:hypothetical protein